MSKNPSARADAPRIRMVIDAIRVARFRIEQVLQREGFDYSPGQQQELLLCIESLVRDATALEEKCKNV